MSKIKFYRQERYDGGIRSGIGIDELPVMHHFQPGSDPEDSALQWFVDIVIEGPDLPNDAEGARNWLRDHSEMIQAGLRETAEHLRVGLDDASAPFVRKLPATQSGITGRISVSGVRSLESGDLADVLEETASQWDEGLSELEGIQVGI